MLHLDQGTEFENALVKELQLVFGVEKNRTSAYCSQRNAVLERVHGNIHNVSAIYVDTKQDTLAELRPFAQIAHDTACNKTLADIPHYIMFGHRAKVINNVIFSAPSNAASHTGLVFSHQTVANLYRSSTDHADKQANQWRMNSARILLWTTCSSSTHPCWWPRPQINWSTAYTVHNSFLTVVRRLPYVAGWQTHRDVTPLSSH